MDTSVKRRICVVTGSRAEYGLLYCVMRELARAPDVDLQLVVTGMHLAAQFGGTRKVIEDDGFHVDAEVDMLLANDSRSAVTKSIGLGVIGFSDVYARLQPDIVLVLGDRFEIFAAVQAAYVANLPVAHIAGGDSTEGAIDEGFRHSITKMAHLHFVTNPESGDRVRQLGENPEHIYDFGSPGIDHILRLQLLSRGQLESALGCRFGARNLLITFHPVTLDPQDSAAQLESLLQVLADQSSDTALFFTMSNADPGTERLGSLIREFVNGRPNAWCFTSLGQLRYLSLMKQADAVLGNSSSGLYEAPSLKVPTVNIGQRQRGRLLADSVITCEATVAAISSALQEALKRDCSRTVNPYGDGRASERIARVLSEIGDPSRLLRKRFWWLRAADA